MVSYYQLKNNLIEYQNQKGRPIIVVPSSDYPGNICLKNTVQLLRDGHYMWAKDI